MPRSDEDAIDWSLTTWEGAERERLRRWTELSLEEIVLARRKCRTSPKGLPGLNRAAAGKAHAASSNPEYGPVHSGLRWDPCLVPAAGVCSGKRNR